MQARITRSWRASNGRGWRTCHATLWQGSPEFYHLMHERRDAMNWIWTTTLNPEQNGGHNIVLLDGDR